VIGRGDRPPGGAPGHLERRIERRRRRPGDLDAGVAPRCEPARRVADPFVADALPAGHGARAVGDEQLAMVPGEVGEDLEEMGRVERADLDSGPAEIAPVAAGGVDASEPVVEHPDGHAVPRPGAQRLGEAPADGIIADDVVLEMDPAVRTGDLREHRGVRGGAVHQQTDAVAGDRACTGSAVHRRLDRPNRGHPVP
jgi:hypothetical protein